MSELISIIVPVYNTAAYLPECLDSMLTQDHLDLEIILVNDGSKDNSLDICNQYAHKDGRIKVIDKENGGAASARNRGLEAAAGKYVMFVDSDDWLEKNCISRAYKELTENDLDLLIWNLAKVTDGKVTVNNAYPAEDVLLTTPEQLLNARATNIYPYISKLNSPVGKVIAFGYTCNKLYRMDIIRELDLRFDEKLIQHEDILFLHYYYNKCSRIKLVTDVWYYYRQIPTSVTFRYKPEIIESNDHFLRTLYQEKDQWPEELLHAYYGRVLMDLKNTILYKVFNRENKEKDSIAQLKQLFADYPYFQDAVDNAHPEYMDWKGRVWLFLYRHRMYGTLLTILKATKRV